MSKDVKKLKQAEYRATHPERTRLACRVYYNKNKIRILSNKKEKFQQFKLNGYSDKRRLYQRINCRYRRVSANCDNPLTVGEWLNILEESNFSCVKCGSSVDLTMDHIIPIVKGGLHTKNNIQVLCRSCNSSKGHKL